jgi:4'-phosphopantetheinyl transferase
VRWLVLDSIATEAESDLAALLDDDERARAARFHFARDRLAFIAAHALARTLISTQLPGAPTDWRFVANEFGKPEVVRTPGMVPLRFNISHTHGLVAVALALEHDVGVDVEVLDPGRLSLDLAERTFAASEVALVRAAPASELTAALYAIWTLKEAYIKAVGKGLSLPLDSFAFSLDPLAIQFSDGADLPSTWLLRRLCPTSRHALALAVRHPAPSSVAIDAGEIDAGGLLGLARQDGFGGQMVRM